MALISRVQVIPLPLLHKHLGQQLMYTIPEQSEAFIKSGAVVGHGYSSAVKHGTEHVQDSGLGLQHCRKKRLLIVKLCMECRI